MPKKYVVIGCGFGDEGKGKVVSYLCSKSAAETLIVRYCGGHQAGHRVIVNRIDHIFSNFGSGTIQGADTYWSPYCTVDPVGILNENIILRDKGINPTLLIDRECPITTPLEKIANMEQHRANGHGTCGVGITATWKREEAFYSLKARDLEYPWVLKTKLESIRFASYYRDLYTKGFTEIINKQLSEFLEDCHILSQYPNIRFVDEMPNFGYSNIIYEGAQGLLLDQHIGFFPHVTWGNIGMKNIIEMSGEDNYHIYLVTRAYQTRHGNGPMTNENFDFDVVNPHEHNNDKGTQGKFRVAPLDLDLLKYSINSDPWIRKSKTKTLVITCVDVMKEVFTFTRNGNYYEKCDIYEFLNSIKSHINIKEILLSYGPEFDKMSNVY